MTSPTEEEMGMAERPPGQKRLLAMYWILLGYFLLLALDLWLLWVLPTAPAIDKISFMLGMVGLYNLALNFLSQTDLFKAFPSWLDEMTSPTLREFSAGALRTAGIASLVFGLFIKGFPPPRAADRISTPLALIVVVATPLVTVIVVAVYLVLIAPLAFIGYLLVSIFFDAIENAPEDFLLSSEEGQLTVKAAVRGHRVQLRTLAVGLPATIVAVGTTAFSLFA